MTVNVSPPLLLRDSQSVFFEGNLLSKVRAGAGEQRVQRSIDRLVFCACAHVIHLDLP